MLFLPTSSGCTTPFSPRAVIVCYGCNVSFFFPSFPGTTNLAQLFQVALRPPRPSSFFFLPPGHFFSFAKKRHGTPYASNAIAVLRRHPSWPVFPPSSTISIIWSWCWHTLEKTFDPGEKPVTAMSEPFQRIYPPTAQGVSDAFVPKMAQRNSRPIAHFPPPVECAEIFVQSQRRIMGQSEFLPDLSTISAGNVKSLSLSLPPLPRKSVLFPVDLEASA